MSCNPNNFLSASDARSKVIDDKLVNAEISAIQQLILDAIDACPGGKLSIIIKTGTPITSLLGIDGFTIISGGALYAQSSPVVTVTTTTGTGFAATAIIDPISGVVTALNITNFGLNYAANDAINISHAGGITGVNFAALVNQVSRAASFSIDFSNDFTIVDSSLTPGIVGIGAIIGYTITNPGTNYFDAPHIHLIDPANTGAGFVGIVNLNPGGTITSVTIVEAGENYSDGTAAVIWGTNTGIPAIITVQAAHSVLDVSVDVEYYHSVWNKQITNTLVTLQLDTILRHFYSKGYNISIQTNPDTMNTIQWSISW